MGLGFALDTSLRHPARCQTFSFVDTHPGLQVSFQRLTPRGNAGFLGLAGHLQGVGISPLTLFRQHPIPFNIMQSASTLPYC